MPKKKNTKKKKPRLQLKTYGALSQRKIQRRLNRSIH